MIKGFAPVVTRVVPTIVWANIQILPTAAEMTPVFGGQSVRVWGATASNLTGSNVHVAVFGYPAGGAGWGALIGPNQTIVVPIPFIVPVGLAIACDTASACSFTFFHSQIT